MIPQGVAKRYAKALLNSALKADIARDVYDEASAFRAILDGNRNFKLFLLSPQTPIKEKKGLIETALGDRASDLFKSLLLLLIDKKRFNFIEEIIDGYTYYFERHHGIVEVKVITAIPLNESMEKKVTKRLRSELGQDVRIVKETDPEIIGGMVLIMEEKIIDGSIRFQIEKMRRELDEIRI